MLTRAMRAWRPCALMLAAGSFAACSSSGEPSDDGGEISMVTCNATWMAVQDGDGAWEQVVPAGYTYDFAIPSGHGGLALVRLDQSPYPQRLYVIYGTTAELRNVASYVSKSECGEPVFMVGTLVGGDENTVPVSLYLGMWSGTISTLTTNYQVPGLPGVRDLYALGGNQLYVVDSILQRRGVTVTNGGTLAPLDFSGPEAFATISSTLNISGMTGDTVMVKSSFLGHDRSTFFDLNNFYSLNGTTVFQVQSLPGGKLQQGDLQFIEATNIKLDIGGANTAGLYFTDPANHQLDIGPDLSIPTGSIIATTPNRRYRVQVAAQPQYSRIMTASFVQYHSAAQWVQVDVAMTAKYLGHAPSTWDITVPDLSSVAGWEVDWGLLDEGDTFWSAIGEGGTVPLLDTGISGGETSRRARRPPLP